MGVCGGIDFPRIHYIEAFHAVGHPDIGGLKMCNGLLPWLNEFFKL